MPKDKINLHQLTVLQLQAKLFDFQADLVDARLKLQADQLKDVHAPAKIRHHIAAVKTILHQKLQEVK